MVTDAFLTFDKNAEITTSKLGNVINLGALKKVAKGSPVFLNLKVHSAVAIATGEDYIIHLVNSTSPTMTQADATGIRWTFVRGGMPAGTTKRIHLPLDKSFAKYLSVYHYIETTANSSGNSISVYLTIGDDSDV